MNDRCLALGLTVIVVELLVSTGAPAQSLVPRTAWGQPDLQGVWDFRSITPLQRPEELADREFLTVEEVAGLEQATIDREEDLLNRPARRTTAGGSVDRGEDGALGAYNDFWLDRGTTIVGNRRTSLIVDPPNGRMPARTAEATKRAEARRDYQREHPADSWEDRGLNDRCMFTTGLPIVPSAYNNNVQLFQTPDHLVMLIEMTHTLRVVLLDGRSPADLSQFVGVSRGHWEGDTLVVETTNFHQLTSLRGSTSNARLIERFTRVDAETIGYEFTVEDPDTWPQPWTAQVELTKNDEPLYEYACHEGNYSMEGILAGARAEENAVADGGSPREP
ncbi:MAG: hypothetical protein VX453_01645 [Acidobacteriota bacterium]|nr:hypothetical protein [Acidobacteriota bacterium]